MGQLYVLGEIKGEIRLMALDGATGNLLWSQQLAVVEQSIAQDPLRRWAGVSPRTPTGSWFAPPRPARLWASNWPRARCCGDIATATIGTAIGRTSA